MAKKVVGPGIRTLLEQQGASVNVTRKQASAMAVEVSNPLPPLSEMAPAPLPTITPNRSKPANLISKTIPFRNGYSQDNCNTRRQWVSQFSNTQLKYVSNWWDGKSTDTQILKGNIEMPIGTISMPLGIAGPIPIHGEHAHGEFLLPAATTEGALVASINRGAAALAQSTGVYACAGQQRMTRCPVFKAANGKEAARVGEWVKSMKSELQENVVSKHSRHAVLKDIFTVYDAEYCHAMFVFETGDAAGQNGVTVCTWNSLLYLREHMPADLKVSKSHLDGNLSGDKKGNNFNAVIGRGTSVSAKATIPEKVLNKVLKISSDDLVEYWGLIHRIGERTNQGGGNANIANVLGAVFAATGQDVASVHESSYARTTVEKNHSSIGGINASIFLPCMIVGTVGGGTNLPTQAECLDIMGCRGAGKAKKFAEIVASYCLALDLSTSAAMATDSFATAHDNLGRNRPDEKQSPK